jgi:glycosyltransferase involved in cell wall biosynthesis
MDNTLKPSLKASVWMICYNHEKYIAQAIESVLSQVTTFPFDLIIGEDCSTDNTRAICLSYQERYPQIVKVLAHTSNVGIHKNLILTLNACKGQYIALLEGDDYWTDNYKLQKQVDFLDHHNDFVMCYQKTLQINEALGTEKITNENDHAETGVEEILSRGWFMRTGSIAFRNGVLGEFPSWYFDYNSTDYMLHILLAQHGKIGFLNEVTSVYRRHEGGITKVFESEIIAFWKKKLKMLDVIDEYLQFKYSDSIQILRDQLYHESFTVIIRRPRSLKDVVYVFQILPRLSAKREFDSIYMFLKRRLFGKRVI